MFLTFRFLLLESMLTTFYVVPYLLDDDIHGHPPLADSQRRNPTVGKGYQWVALFCFSAGSSGVSLCTFKSASQLQLKVQLAQ
ncbi:hypothetical protein [Zooshikella ganghwensis]|uniref:hypothetical protein n=1 Tax=Zooshikella ganghwensis TaxID=202772 RepID=UPI00057022C1|nr:hypothetical protein [Zooshikella ganghwensis]